MIASRCFLLVFTVISSAALVGCNRRGPVGGNYPPVTVEELTNKNCLNRTGQDDGSFTWAFSPDKFVLEGTDIPADLLEALLGPGRTATHIEGQWDIVDEMVQFSVTEVDEQEDPRSSSLPIFFTGVIRIQTPDAQYVF